jgi:hypothetical protein
MRTLTVHTADELAVRWKRKAMQLMESEDALESMGRNGEALKAAAQAYRVCAVELQALLAVSMELEAAHHGDPEPRNDVAEGNVWPEDGEES